MKLVTNPDILHRPCDEIFDQKLLNQRVVKLITAMKFLPNARGLADNQIGGTHRVFAIRLEGESTVSIFVNPTFKVGSLPPTAEESKEGFSIDEIEGTLKEECLSLKNKIYSVKRFYEIDVEQKRNGLKCPYFVDELHFTGIDAQCIQHEIDHLNGILISDNGGIK